MKPGKPYQIKKINKARGEKMKDSHYNVIIVGGGAAGTSVANDLAKMDSSQTVAIIEPSENHYYQPAWTLVGAGLFKFKNTEKKQKDLLPSSVKWFKNYVTTFQPEENLITIDSGCELSYDYLVVCPGLQLDIDKIKGLSETLGQNGVCSNYSKQHVEYTWEMTKKMSAGSTALFTQPPMPIKCAGAPQKAMYLAADYFREKGILQKMDIEFFNAGPTIFGVPFFAKELNKVIERYGIKTHYKWNLIEVNGPAKVAIFENTDDSGKTSTLSKHFDMIHVAPPQSAPNFIKESPLSNDGGWLSVDQKTLQHTIYPNIFGLGDVIGTTNAKTAAAVRKQVPIVVNNLLNVINKRSVEASYTGYGSCPLTTSRSAIMMAEFSYGGEVTPSFPYLDPRKNRYIWMLFKRYGLPFLYWKIMLKARRIDIPSKGSYAKKFLDD